MLQRLVTIGGSLVLLFAGYSFRAHRKHLVAIGDENPDAITISLIVQVVLGFLLILVGQLAALKLKHIRVSPTIQTKSFSEVLSRSDYSTLNHRGLQLKKRLAKK